MRPLGAVTGPRGQRQVAAPARSVRRDPDHRARRRARRHPSDPRAVRQPDAAHLPSVVYATLALFAAVLIVYLDRHGYRDVEDTRIQRPAVVPGLPLLRDGVAVDDRLRRHHPDHPVRAADQRPGHHPAARRFPDRADRHHGGNAHRRSRARHSRSSDGGTECATTPSSSATAPRAGPRSPRWSATRSRPPTSSSSTRTDRPRARQERGPGHRARHRHQVRSAAAGQRAAREVDHRRDQPGRHRGAGHPDRPGARAQGQDHRRGPRGREPAPARQSGADSTVVSSETAGRLLGIATQTPSVVEMMEDLLTPDAGFAIAEREVTPKEVGGSPRHLQRHRAGRGARRRAAAGRRARGRRPRDRRPAALHPQCGRGAVMSACAKNKEP